MNICCVKKIVLFVSLLLFAISLAGIYTRQTPDESFLKQAWGGWTGPCEKVKDYCGDVGGGIGTCTLDPGGAWCSGVCPAYCRKGDPIYVCRRVSGSCNHHMDTCGIMDKFTCWMDAHGICYCDPSGASTCARQHC